MVKDYIKQSPYKVQAYTQHIGLGISMKFTEASVSNITDLRMYPIPLQLFLTVQLQTPEE